MEDTKKEETHRLYDLTTHGRIIEIGDEKVRCVSIDGKVDHWWHKGAVAVLKRNFAERDVVSPIEQLRISHEVKVSELENVNQRLKEGIKALLLWTPESYHGSETDAQIDDLLNK